VGFLVGAQAAATVAGLHQFGISSHGLVRAPQSPERVLGRWLAWASLRRFRKSSGVAMMVEYNTMRRKECANANKETAVNVLGAPQQGPEARASLQCIALMRFGCVTSLHRAVSVPFINAHRMFATRLLGARVAAGASSRSEMI